MKRFFKNLFKLIILCILIALSLTYIFREQAKEVANNDFAESTEEEKESVEDEHEVLKLEEKLPVYQGEPYVVLNENQPDFDLKNLPKKPYEKYSEMDHLGRCGQTEAYLSRELMPKEDREDIGSVKPTGWEPGVYPFIDGEFLYHRCHLLGYQLTGENANDKNLITGTQYFNMEGMLPFENQVASCIRMKRGHVWYRVTPVYEGDNLLASGVQMEAYSVEDQGESVCFNVYVFNVQPGVAIDYATGKNWLD